jgi:serine phosphatase RsbU (regulator of sigma subunit)
VQSHGCHARIGVLRHTNGLITAEIAGQSGSPAVAKSINRYLRLHDDSALGAEPSAANAPLACAAGLLAEDDDATNDIRQDPVPKWSAPENPGVGVALGHLRMDLGNEPNQKQLTALLSAVLESGARACEAQAAAVYTLDAATTELQLRASWGLPPSRTLQPARPLEGAVADLEALLGHAVALERASSFGPWRTPERFPAALCVPVSTGTNALGTLWFFSDHERDFTDIHTGLAELTAGRIAAELDRAALIAARVETSETARQLDAARRLQQSQCPQPIRLVDEGWELAGRCTATYDIGGVFYDWLWLPSDALAVIVGQATQTGIAGALTAATIRSAVRTLTEQGLPPGELLASVNRSLWFASGGDETASLVVGTIDLSSGDVRYAWAGEPSAIRVSRQQIALPLPKRPPLGATTDAQFAEQSFKIARAESIIICTRALDAAADTGDRDAIDYSAVKLLDSLAAANSQRPARIDRALVAIKRFA